MVRIHHLPPPSQSLENEAILHRIISQVVVSRFALFGCFRPLPKIVVVAAAHLSCGEWREGAVSTMGKMTVHELLKLVDPAARYSGCSKAYVKEKDGWWPISAVKPDHYFLVIVSGDSGNKWTVDQLRQGLKSARSRRFEAVVWFE